MEIIFGLVIFILILYAILLILSEIGRFLEDVYIYLFIDTGLIPFILDNYFALLAISCSMMAIIYLILFKPHKAEEYFIQYKNDQLTRYQAIVKISDTMYRRGSGVPSVISSKLTERRIRALRKRVRAEESFINDLKSYIRTKES